jgi:anti-sigma factor RsiW
MTCQDCELFLAQSETSAEIEEHLRECPECHALHEDLRANTVALDGLRSEDLPRLAVMLPPHRRTYPWAAGMAAAAAALFALVLLVPRTRTLRPAAAPLVSQAVDQPAQEQPPPQAFKTAKAGPVRLRPEKGQPLKIKMLTSDPDVVIYWLIED